LKVWIDITAPAHVLVFRPLIAIMRERGDEVEITARDYAQTVELLAMHGLEADAVIGQHAGRFARPESPPDDRPARRAQALGEGPRLRRRARARLPRADDHGAPARDPELDDVRLRVRDVPAPARLPRGDAGRRADAIPPERLQPYGVKPPKLLQYPGLKEEYYLADFEPDRSLLERFGVDPARVLVVLRPPPDVSLYHRHSNPLFRKRSSISAARRACRRSSCRALTSSGSMCAGSRCRR